MPDTLPPPPPPQLWPAERSPGFWWRVLSPVGAVVLAFIFLFAMAGFGIAILGEAHQDAVGTAAVFLGGLAILLLGVALLANLPRHERAVAMGIKHTGRGAVLHGINMGIGMVIAAGVIVVLGTLIDPGLEDRLQDVSDELGPGLWGTVLTIVALVVLAPLGEELLFRVLLLRALVRRMPFWPSAIVSGTVFASAHLDAWITLFWPRFIALAVVGVGLAWLYRWRGYWASVTAHATVNTVATIALLAQ